MAAKKGKGGGKGGGGKANGNKGTKPPPTKPGSKQQNDLLREPQQTPQERVDAVRPLWESLSPQQRLAMLSIDIDQLRTRSRLLSEAMVQQHVDACEDSNQAGPEFLVLEASIDEMLEEGVRRLEEKGTWKLWAWGAPDQLPEEFFDAESFRTFVTENHIREDLRRLLPRDDPKAPEKPAEAAFRQRMLALLQKVQQSNRQGHEELSAGRANRRKHMADAAPSGRTANVELIHVVLEALSKEYECIYQSLLQPLAAYIMEVLPDGGRKTAKTDLALEDLERLEPDQAACIVEWLTEKVDSLSTKLKADPKEDDEPEDEEENMGDVDLWTVVEKDGVKSLAINEMWLHHLQDRLLGDDGQPRKAKPGEDPHSCGLVLEWVYGSIVSTAEKARDAARRNLGNFMASAGDAHAMLLRALEDYYIWESRGKQAKELMADMLKSRLEMQDLAKQFDIQALPRNTPVEDLPGDPGEAALPSHVIVSMLRREVLLTKAKLHFLVFEHLQQEKTVRTLKVQLRQGEPEFERLKRELDEVKHQHRGMDGTFRSAAEVERHRAQLADAAIEEQLEVQTAFREQGARLQAIYDKKQRAEFEMTKRENEIKQLQAWKGTVESNLDKLNDMLAAMGIPASAAVSPALEPAGEAPLSAEDQAPASAAADAEMPDVSAAVAAVAGARSAAGDVPESCSGAAGGCEEATAAQPVSSSSSSMEDVGEEPAMPDAGRAKSAWAAAPQLWEASPQQYMQLSRLRNHFQKDLRRQLYGDAEDKQLFESFKQEVKVVEQRLEEARVALQHLEMALINTACDDPGITIGMQLALPILQERLDAHALEYAAERAKMAEGEIIKMELEQQAREAAERERRLKAKQSKKDKVRSERDKAAAEKAAEKAAEEQRRADEEAARRQQQEEERRRRLELLELLRREEEEHMEARRRELLSDENGYWRRRMDAEEAARSGARAEAEAEAEAGREAASLAAAPGTPELAAVAPAREEEADSARQGAVGGSGRAQRGPRGSGGGRQANETAQSVSSSQALGRQQQPAATQPQPQPQQAEAHASSVVAQPRTGPDTGPAPGPAASPAPVPAASPAPLLAGVGAGAEGPRGQGPAAPDAGNSGPMHHPAMQQQQQQQQQQHMGMSPVRLPPPHPMLPQQPASNPGPPGPVMMHPAQGPGPHHPPQAFEAQGPHGPQGPHIHHMPPQMMPHPMHPMHGPGMPPGARGPQPHMHPGHQPQPMHPHAAAGMARPPHPMGPGGPMMPPREDPGMPGHYPPHPHPHHMMPPGPGLMHPAAMNGPGPMFQYHHGPGPHGHLPPHGHPGMMQHPGPMQHPGMMHPPAMQQPGMMQGGPFGMHPYPHPHQHPHPHMPLAAHGAEASAPAAAKLPKGPPGAGAGEAGAPAPVSGKSLALSIAAKPFVPAAFLRPSPVAPAPQQQQQQQPAPEVGPQEAGVGASGEAMQQQQQQQQAIPPEGQMYVNTQLAPELRQQVKAAAAAGDNGAEAAAYNRAPRGRRDAGKPFARQPPGARGDGGGGGPEGDGQQLAPLAPAINVALGQGNGGRSTSEDSSVGCSVPLSPLAHLDAAEVEAEASDSSHSTCDERLEAEEQWSGSGGGEGRGGVRRSSAAELVQPDSDEAEAAEVAAPHTPPVTAAAAAAAGGRRATWSSVASGESAAQAGAGAGASGRSAGEARAAAEAAAEGPGRTWKQKLQQNLPPPPPPPQQLAPRAPAHGQVSPPRAAATPGRSGVQAEPGPGSCTSAALMAEAPKPLPGALRKGAGGRLVFEPREQPGPSVQLQARALLNRGAQNNCFLNVIVQSLWHLPSFRQPMLALRAEALEGGQDAGGGGPGSSKRVMQAVWSIFKAMEAGPASGGEGEELQGGVVSPQALREALRSQSSSLHVDPSEMHDAGEVLADILSLLHREELGQPGAVDLQLPTRVVLRPEAAGAAAAAAGAAKTLVHRLFGLDLQQPYCASDDGNDGSGGPRRGGKQPKRPTPAPDRSGSWRPKGPGAAAASPLGPGVLEVQQYTKFFHLVPAQGLRKAAAARPQGSFEELLRELDGSSAAGPERRGPGAGGGSAAQARCTMLRRPGVFTLAVVWESAQAPVDAIRGTVEALGCELRVSDVFGMADAGPTYALRSVVCYFGHHYLVYALSLELGLWLQLDDEEVALVGQWADVCRALVARRLQPSLLFFEEAGVQP